MTPPLLARPVLRAGTLLAALAGGLPAVRAVDSTTVFNELCYHPAPGGTEWIELHNQMSVNMDLSGWRITGGVDYTFPPGTVIASGAYLVVSADTAAVPGSIGPFAGNLANQGETIRLRNVSGRLMDELTWADDGRWPVGADGSGATLAKRDPRAGGAEPEAWTASWQLGGTPAGRNFPEGELLGPAQTLLAHGATWVHLQGTDPGPGWAATLHTAGADGWAAGSGAFAHEDGTLPLAIGTVLANPDSLPLPSAHFQTTFAFSGDPARTRLTAQLLVDDGAVVFLNGTEILRHNMPTGEVTAATRAASQVSDATLVTLELPADQLVAGENVLSVSVHDGPPAGAGPVTFTRVEEGGTMDAAGNLALASKGAVAFAKDLLPGYAPTHTIPNLNNGTYGNSSSWIGNSLNSFCGINLGATPVTVGGLAFGRDNTGGFTDRTLGTYTVQYTTVPNPSAATPEGSWTTLASLVYSGAGTPFFAQPPRRHRYEFPAVQATGIRLICPGNGIGTGSCVDELELYGSGTADMAFDLALTARETLPQPGDTRVLINELAGAGEATFRVELTNAGSSAVDLATLRLGGVTLPAGTLEPGGYIVLDETQLGFHPAAGTPLFLTSGGTLVDAAVVRATARARSGSRGGKFLAPSAPTFGSENTFSLPTDVVINEIMYHFPPRPSSPGSPAVTQSDVILPLSATWRYHAGNVNLGAAWAQTAHEAGVDGWLSGQALLGFETTPTSLPEPLRTPFASSSAPTYYFETEFTLTEAQLATLDAFVLEHVIDDGAAFYINGVELTAARFNLPAGFSFATLASVGIGNGALSAPVTVPVEGLNLQAGVNRLSVEVHNQLLTSNDMVCGVRLSTVSVITPEVPATPVTDDPEEWIELHNKGDDDADLSGWKLDGAAHFTFPPGTTLPAGDFLVVSNDAVALATKWPEVAGKIVGNFSGNLPNSGGRIELEDAAGNPADEALWTDGDWADGGGSSLELADPRADNAQPGAWAASDESGKSQWQTFTWRANGGQSFGPTTWNEFRLGMLDAGECLIDDVSVRANPDGAATELIQNGSFEAQPAGAKWRLLGNHGGSAVVTDPAGAGNKVLHFAATGPTETNHNHAETTLAGNVALSAITPYEVSFRARWLAGSNQLNARGYYQKLARTTELPIPAKLGTPGAANSRHAANTGPQITALTHSPAVPASGAGVTVTCRATDPDGVTSVTLRWRADGAATFQSVPMALADGQWTAALPGRTAGQVAQFYVEATDSLAATTTGPAAGPDSRALVQWADGQATSVPAQEFRLIMLTADRDFLLNTYNRLSNDRLPGTFVDRGSDVVYDVGVRLQGTAAGRVRDGESYVGYDIGFPPDRKFRGVHDSVGIDRSGRAPAVRQQDEIYVRHTFQAAGIPCPVDDLCYFIAPFTAHTGTAILQLASYGGLWAESQFDEQGTVYNFDITYDPSSTSVGGDPESVKPPVPFTHVTTDFANLGPDKEQYRGPFDIRAGKRRDDYRALITLNKTMSSPDQQLAAAAPEVLDLDEVLRCTALVNLWGIGDTYYTGGLPHNIRLFTPDDGTGVNFLPWDMDFAMSGATNSPLAPTANSLGRLINNIPANKRRYLGHVRHLCATVFKSAYLSPWLAHYGSVVGQNFSGAAGYVDARAAFAATQYPPNAAFAITTGGGADFSVAAREVTLEGTGWIDVHHFVRLGSADPVVVEWPTLTTWRTTLALAPGANVIALEARGFDGELLATTTITVTNTLPEPSVRDFLRVTELHYHPADPEGAETAVATSDGDFEFIEVRNLGSETLALTGVHFGAGVDFTVPPGTTLAAGAFGVIVRNRVAFEARYGSGLPVIGEYLTDALSNSGETITLLDATGAVVQSFAYSDAWFPSADGPGWSLVVRDESNGALDLNLPTAWALSAQRHGNPGAANGAIFASEFEGWRHVHFSEAELADPAVSGPDAVHGGIPNALRHALGLGRNDDPTPALPQASFDGTDVLVSHRRLATVLDAALLAELSDDLVTWGPPAAAPQVQDHGDGTQTVTHRLPASVRGFLRLRVVPQP